MKSKKAKRTEPAVSVEDMEKDQQSPDLEQGTADSAGAGNAAEDLKDVASESTQDAVSEPSREIVLEERLLRLQADFENFRKRTLREREDLYRRANEDIMLELLPVLDHLELAFNAAGKDSESLGIVQGFRLVGEQLQQVLQKFGLEPIVTDGVDFDPNVHEAIQHLPSAEVPENGVIARTRAGYMLGNRLLRAAQVVVSSGEQQESAAENEDV